MDIHLDIDEDTSYSTPMRAYTNPRSKPEFRGCQTELLIFPKDGETVLSLHGTSTALRKLLTGALSMLDDCEEVYKEEMADHAAHAVECEHCGGWYDTRSLDPRHADGQGMLCNLDGSVWVREGALGEIEIVETAGVEVVPSSIEMKHLRKGDRFRRTGKYLDVRQEVLDGTEPPNAYETTRLRVFEALCDAEKVFEEKWDIPHSKWAVRVAYVKEPRW